MRKEIVVGVLMIFVVAGVGGLVSAENGESNYTAEIDPEVYVAFENFGLVQVIVEVKSRDLINNTISSIPETEFRFIREMEFSTGFVGEITEKGLNTLINNQDVIKISFDRVGRALENETEGEKEEILEEKNDKIKSKKINFLWLAIPILIIMLLTIYLIFRKKKI